jgi:hypothetical protein
MTEPELVILILIGIFLAGFVWTDLSGWEWDK